MKDWEHYMNAGPTCWIKHEPDCPVKQEFYPVDDLCHNCKKSRLIIKRTMWWTKFKILGGVALALLSMLFAGLWQRSERKRAEDELGDEQAARAVEAKAHKAMRDGLIAESKLENKRDKKPAVRGRFSNKP